MHIVARVVYLAKRMVWLIPIPPGKIGIRQVETQCENRDSPTGDQMRSDVTPFINGAITDEVLGLAVGRSRLKWLQFDVHNMSAR
jgi:hypothetical protein